MSSWRARVGVALVLSVLVSSVLAAVPVTAQPSGCDADGDGSAGGVVETLFSDGEDDAARALEADTGVVLGQAQEAHRWRVAVCVEAGGAEGAVVRSVAGAPVEELAPEASAWEAEALEAGVGELRPQLFRPGPRTSPHVAGMQVVGIEMWLAVDPAAWVPFTTTAGAGEVSVTATATPRRVVWEFSDGVSRICEGPGVQYSPGAPGPAPCGRHFEHTTEVVPVALSVSIDYDLAWTSTLGNSGSSTLRGEANRYELVVGEVQTYLTDGQRRAPPPPPVLADPASSQPMDDRHCTWSSFWDCSAPEIVDAAVDTLGAKDLSEAIKADSEAFISDFLADTLEMDLMRRDPARWAGKIGCEVAVAVFTGGAGSARIVKLLSDTDKLRDWARRHDSGDGDDAGGDGDGNGAPQACRTSSFPTGTLVLAADGTRRPIETIGAGDAVQAFDPATGTWQPREVSAQWSYLDTDEMATLTLADGSAVTATDHHRFYDAGEGRFEALGAEA